MVHQISFHADVAGEHVSEKLFRESRFTLQQAEHHSLFDTNDGAGLKCARSGNAKRLSGKRAFAEEAFLWKVGDDGFLAARRHDGELHLASLDVKDCIGRIALRKDGVISLVCA